MVRVLYVLNNILIYYALLRKGWANLASVHGKKTGKELGISTKKLLCNIGERVGNCRASTWKLCSEKRRARSK